MIIWDRRRKCDASWKLDTGMAQIPDKRTIMGRSPQGSISLALSARGNAE